jgi:hypothetical protein
MYHRMPEWNGYGITVTVHLIASHFTGIAMGLRTKPNGKSAASGGDIVCRTGAPDRIKLRTRIPLKLLCKIVAFLSGGRVFAQACRNRSGGGCALCPDMSDLHLFRYRQRIVHLDA